jgi:citrate lyase beta subunit
MIQAATTRADLALCRSFLFTPGNRPERFAKGAASGADALILDLEDAVSMADKDAARRTVMEHFSGDYRAGLAPHQLKGLRVNNIHTPAGVRDLEALVTSKATPDFVALPKVESAFEVQLYAKLLVGTQGHIPFMVAIETAKGVEAAFLVTAADARVRSLGFGGADLAVDLRAELAWEPMYAARARMVQAAASVAIGCVDVPQIALDDEAGLAEVSARVKAMGFTGKLAIHPKQIGPIHAAFTPSAAEVERARGIVAAFKASGGNVVEFQGKMVEGPIVKAAERILQIADR